MPAHRASLGLVAALGVACGRPNPAFELAIETVSASATGDVTGTGLPTSGATSVDASDSDSRTAGSGSSGTSGDVSGSGDVTLTGVASTTTATTGECTEPIAPGQPCGPDDCCAGCSACVDGMCIPDSTACGACSACDGDGLCIPLPEQTPCEAEADPCADTVWGLQGGDCFAALSPAGECNLAGECVAKPGCEPGELIAKCDVSCVIDPTHCAQGMPVAQFNVAKMCAQEGPTPACTDECLFEAMSDTAVQKSCVAGKCTPSNEQPCGNYACKGKSCNVQCENADDCKFPYSCEDKNCV